MTNPKDIGQIAREILADMPLKEKAAIANLDERFDQGQITESEYQAQREQLKERALRGPD